MTIEEQATSISHTREHVAGAPRYDPDLVAEDAHDFFGLYPYYGIRTSPRDGRGRGETLVELRAAGWPQPVGSASRNID
jgi:hypothetical protein